MILSQVFKFVAKYSSLLPSFFSRVAFTVEEQIKQRPALFSFCVSKYTHSFCLTSVGLQQFRMTDSTTAFFWMEMTTNITDQTNVSEPITGGGGLTDAKQSSDLPIVLSVWFSPIAITILVAMFKIGKKLVEVLRHSECCRKCSCVCSSQHINNEQEFTTSCSCENTSPRPTRPVNDVLSTVREEEEVWV